MFRKAPCIAKGGPKELERAAGAGVLRALKNEYGAPAEILSTTPKFSG